MEFIKLTRNNCHYSYKESTSIKMDIISNFLSDIGCDNFIVNWAKSNEDWAETYGTNTTFLEKDEGYVFLENTILEEGEIPNYTKMTCLQFIQLLDDWQEKVCIPRPKEVIIRYENDQYTIETNN